MYRCADIAYTDKSICRRIACDYVATYLFWRIPTGPQRDFAKFGSDLICQKTGFPGSADKTGRFGLRGGGAVRKILFFLTVLMERIR